VHRTNLCAACHADLTRQHPDDGVAAKTVDCAACHPLQSETYGANRNFALGRVHINGSTCKAALTRTRRPGQETEADTGAILNTWVRNIYLVMFDPDAYPMNWAWLDGKVSGHWHAEEHPLDTAARATPPTGPAPPTAQSSARSSATTPS
jgi:hypothetical protein